MGWKRKVVNRYCTLYLVDIGGLFQLVGDAADCVYKDTDFCLDVLLMFAVGTPDKLPKTGLIESLI